ncbi:hypothetical protein NIBR502772_00225 [Pseudarthrobacter sp. NIBRBAC000502772]|uniref:hypothetical protein n=1 Tax=Pseudarthrobacter sp. NIBRBAC000502772 TaxID=2590775 RepID=UPI001131BEF3|nr:hypothetical protein [Pseudarthrobacter sp. NIBRBAC000502772]QDG64839.1 hypothetical protein NIBR502772_00225 [Pseudarthrobacter sp. NIBRBAC000502772]
MNQQTVGPSGGTRICPDQQPVLEWGSLQHGDCVEVWSIDSFLYAAYVDDGADDGGLIWVIENCTGCRRLFVRDDPVVLYSI